MIRLEKREDLTWDVLKDWFKYNPKTGDLIRLKRYDSYEQIQRIPKLIRSKNNRGYYWVRVFGHTFLAHRLIWLYMTGEHPTQEIDHINGDRLDNRFINLRQVSPFENSRNQGIRKDCTSQCRGVHYDSRKGVRGKPKWIARISHKGVRYVLGQFDTFDEAVLARRQAEIDFGYHPNHAKREAYHYGD